jgi:hypothetical protein
MLESRSSSQILFSLLPEQTVDLKGRIWKVEKWQDPFSLPVDLTSVRKRLLSAVDPWRRNSQDNGASNDLHANHSLEVVTLNKERGVKVVAWPNNWICRQCRRMGTSNRTKCKCGSNQWGQFHFVAYHGCGHIAEPWIPRCATHNEVEIRTPRSSNVKDLIFACPVCKAEVRRGLGFAKCPGCQQPGLNHNVHRAASVYTPHTFTMVNPARPEQLREIHAQGGSARCLDWVMDGMPGDKPSDQLATRETFIEGLLAQGLDRFVAEAAADAAAAGGHKFTGGNDRTPLKLGPALLEAARDEAMDLALAVHEGRRAATNLPDEPVGPELKTLYKDEYLPALSRAGLEQLDLVDRFPVLRGVFGYSRGGGVAGEKRLVMFRGRAGSFRVYGDANETEAYLLRLDPVRVTRFLHARGLMDAPVLDPEVARRTVLELVNVPERGADVPTETAGSAVLTLLHSYTHRMVRQLAVMAGIDREALAEYLVPRHLAAFVYAGTRGDFVLGGLQAVFETDLHLLLDRQVHGESRCPLDPGCARGGAACLACLHLGEPSCTYYNRFLDRSSLFGQHGFLSMEA